MRQHLAKLGLGVLVGGCSLIYNPNNIDRPPADARLIDMGEMPVDVEIRADASPRDLEVTEAFPATIDEGTGTGGSRPAIVVVRGKHFVKDAAAELMVMVAPATAGAATLDSFEVAGNGDYIALAITAPVVTACNEGTSVALDITVMQNDGIGGTVTRMLDDAVSVRCLDELDNAPASANDLKDLYSRIAISGPLDFPAETADAAVMRSASSISIGGALDASADARNPGPGGGIGGAAAGNGAGLRPGSSGGSGAGGGGAGFLVAGTAGGNGVGTGGSPGAAIGDVWISKYSENGGSGGGGGGNGTGLGGVGGGGGGTIELTASGDISVGAITADGASGATGGTLAGDGGAGTGGVVVIRAGNMLTAGSISVAKGAKVGNGGASSDGRVRVDAAKGSYPTGLTTCVVPFAANCNMTMGPIFVDLPTHTTVQKPMIDLRGTPGDDTATLRVFDKAGNVVVDSTTGTASYKPTFGGTGSAAVPAVLKAGYNRVCVWVAGGIDTIAESANCQTIAYLPQ